jgi:hypothetical protein
LSCRVDERRILAALNQLERETGQPMRKGFLNKVYLNRKKDAKLTLLSFVTNKSESKIAGELITQYIRNFENENGKLEILAKELLKVT